MNLFTPYSPLAKAEPHLHASQRPATHTFTHLSLLKKKKRRKTNSKILFSDTQTLNTHSQSTEGCDYCQTHTSSHTLPSTGTTASVHAHMHACTSTAPCTSLEGIFSFSASSGPVAEGRQ